MSAAALPPNCQIERINYYTAHISGRVDTDAPRRQDAYLRAISTLPNVVIHYGNFLVSQKWRASCSRRRSGHRSHCRPGRYRKSTMSGRPRKRP